MRVVTGLPTAIERLYEVFARYELRGPVDGCPCCVSEEMKSRLVGRPLRKLTGNDLGRYSMKAMTTWGGVDHYRHFLPRLCELVANMAPLPNGASSFCLSNFGSELSFDYLCMKLESAEWREWPTAEYEAILDFFLALWRAAIAEDSPEIPAGSSVLMEIFVGLAYCKPGFEPFLRICVDTLTPSSVAFLRELAVELISFTAKGAISATLAIHWNQVRDARPGVLEVLLADDTAARLEADFFDEGSSANKAELSELIAAVERLRRMVTTAG